MPLRNALHAVLDFCFPGACASCESACAGKSPICEACAVQLEAISSAPCCRRCASPIVLHGAPCPYCNDRGMRPLKSIVALARFDEPLRKLVHTIKYHKAWPLAEFLADGLFQQERVRALLKDTAILVPIPLHPRRQMSRGFNQATVVATRLKKHCQLELRDALARLRDTETQTHFRSQAQRYRNMKDAFALLHPGIVTGRHVILVDDVKTSGATLRAAAKAVKLGRPASISAIVLAVADARGRGFERA